MKARTSAILGLGILVAVCAAPGAKAQTVDPKARSKTTWYHAPHEIQIIDETPAVKDFREAPTAPSGIQMPPAPQGFGSPGGGGGGGAMGDGGNPTLPAGGMQLPGNGPGYRTDTPGMPGMGSLPKSGFGRNTNIPAGGMGPKTMLPSGQTTGVHGSLMTPTAHSAPAAAGAGNRAAMRPTAMPSTPAASYGGNYAQPTGGASRGGGVNTNVQGKLLNRLLKQ